jgi:hypothetical protein
MTTGFSKKESLIESRAVVARLERILKESKGNVSSRTRLLLVLIIFGQLGRAKLIASNIDLGKLMKFITDENQIQPAIYLCVVRLLKIFNYFSLLPSLEDKTELTRYFVMIVLNTLFIYLKDNAIQNKSCEFALWQVIGEHKFIKGKNSGDLT